MTPANNVQHKFDLGKTAEELVPDLTNRYAYFFSMILSFAVAGVLWGLYRRIPMIVPLYFTEPWGEAELAPKMLIFLMPGIPMAVTAGNIILARFFGKTSPTLSRVLSVAAGAVTIMFAAGVYGIIQSLFL